MSKNFRKCKKFIHSFCLNFDYISCVYFRYSFSADKCSNSSAVLLRFCLLGKHDLRRNRCANDRFIHITLITGIQVVCKCSPTGLLNHENVVEGV